MTAPIGAVVGIYVDLIDRVSIGDMIETSSGRRYQVLTVREQQRGAHVGRQHLRCLVAPCNWSPSHEGAKTHRIAWYKRTAKRRR
jgi:hypothetical protein